MLVALLLGIIGLVFIYGRVTIKPLPKCNEAWPQSYSNLVIQPCPTPMVE